MDIPRRSNHTVIILGAGITGVTVARLLQQSGISDFVILEALEEAGGLCRSKVIDGHVLDTGGGHFLCTRHSEVYDFIFSHLPESEFNKFDRVSKIKLGDNRIDYPIEYNLWQLPLEDQVDYLVSCLSAGEISLSREPESFERWIRWKLGGKIADDYLLPYNRKIWGVEPNQLDTDWLHKIPAFNVRELVKSVILGKANKKFMPSHQIFYYPKKGGFQRIFDAIAEPVKHRIHYGEAVVKLEKTADNWTVNDAFNAPTVISTIPWHHVDRAMGGVPELSNSFDNIHYSALVVSLHEMAYSHPDHWCYIPDIDVPHHREFYIRNFAPHSKANGIYRETNLKRWSGEKPSIYFQVNDYAYPIPTKGHAESSDRINDHFSHLGLYGVGRWGQHRYYNSDVCIFEAMKLVRRLLDSNRLVPDPVKGSGRQH